MPTNFFIMNKIMEAVTEYNNALDKIGENRKLWAATKELIYDTLTEIQKAGKLDWQVQKVEGLKNSEAVNIHFNKQASGLVRQDHKGIKSYIKYGGALIFTQAYNGSVFVMITYPYVDELVGQVTDKVLEKVSPNDITKEFVETQALRFLEEMTSWEISTENKIGFVQH